MRVLITGAAGFIGFHLAERLCKEFEVYGIDNFNSYYAPALKFERERYLKTLGVRITHQDIIDPLEIKDTDVVIHLAALAGIRHSLEHPLDYIRNNIIGTQNLINACEAGQVPVVLYASTSCIMDGNTLPWKEEEPTKHQLNPYGYSKYTNECQFMVSKIPSTIGMRFFTVYGPYGRPDMALFKFAKAIVENQPIELYNYGNMKRDFTYVTDIVEGVYTLIKYNASHEIFNIGRGQQVNLMDFVHEIEKNLGKEAQKILAPRHPAEGAETWANIDKLKNLGWGPKVSIDEGVKNFCDWYKDYYKV